MIVEDSKYTRAVKNVAATMAIENMYLDKTFINELIKVSKGEKSSEQLIQEVKKEYAR